MVRVSVCVCVCVYLGKSNERREGVACVYVCMGEGSCRNLQY